MSTDTIVLPATQKSRAEIVRHLERLAFRVETVRLLLSIRNDLTELKAEKAVEEALAELREYLTS